MKSNEALKSTNYVKFFKPCLIVILAIILIGAVVVGFFGFNTSLDFSGGTQLVVEFTGTNYPASDDETLAKAEGEIRQILYDYNVDINSFQIQGEYNSRAFVITFKNVEGQTLDKIRLDINKLLKEDDSLDSSILGEQEDLTFRTSKIDSFVASSEFLTIVSALIFAITLICVYACFRFKVAGALTILFGAVADLLLFLSFVALARIEVNRYLFVALALIMIVSVYASVSMFIDIKQKAKEPSLSTKSNQDLVNMYVDQNWKKNLFIYVAVCLALVVWGILSTTNVMYTLIALIAGLVVIFGTHIFVVPAFWSSIQRTRETFTKRGILRTEASGKVAVKQEKLNEKDSSAKVIDVEEN